jgi:hypothetical protein
MFNGLMGYGLWVNDASRMNAVKNKKFGFL